MINLKLKAKVCPFCDKKHEVTTLFEILQVAVYPIITDVVYFSGVANKKSRLTVKEILGLK